MQIVGKVGKWRNLWLGASLKSVPMIVAVADEINETDMRFEQRRILHLEKPELVDWLNWHFVFRISHISHVSHFAYFAYYIFHSISHISHDKLRRGVTRIDSGDREFVKREGI